MTYDVWTADGARTVADDVTAQFAAGLVGIDPYELEWSAEEFGRCDVDGYVVVPAGEPFPDRDTNDTRQ